MKIIYWKQVIVLQRWSLPQDEKVRIAPFSMEPSSGFVMCRFICKSVYPYIVFIISCLHYWAWKFYTKKGHKFATNCLITKQWLWSRYCDYYYLYYLSLQWSWCNNRDACANKILKSSVSNLWHYGFKSCQRTHAV